MEGEREVVYLITSERILSAKKAEKRPSEWGELRFSVLAETD